MALGAWNEMYWKRLRSIYLVVVPTEQVHFASRADNSTALTFLPDNIWRARRKSPAASAPVENPMRFI